ncbi:hypothetical protein Lalb_Chr16g0385731 [Lupinus albus]|uniref:Uncharacterized protein n=1 Tax=Lupinus albus TaxID=3870 RepID=A0A6A4P6J4_LUPAL|nr:hypothetical protein Lalb_Chr16g0385731 [Lupinus albus]
MFPDQKPVRPSRFAATKFGSKTMSLIKFLALFIIVLPSLMLLRLTFPNHSSYLKMGFDQERILNRIYHNGTSMAQHGTILLFCSVLFSVLLLIMCFSKRACLDF